MIFSSLGWSVLGKTVPSVLSTVSGQVADGPTGRRQLADANSPTYKIE